MKREISHDQQREEAAIRLLGATRLTDGEIERIASAPHLFGSIRTRIAERNIEEAAATTSAFGWLGVKAISAAAVVVAGMAVAAFIALRSDVPRMQVAA